MSYRKYKYLLSQILKCMTTVWFIFCSNLMMTSVKPKEVIATATTTTATTTTTIEASKSLRSTTHLVETSCMEDGERKMKYLFILLKEGVAIERKILTEQKQDVILKCPFNHSAYQWYRNGYPLNISNGTLTIKAFKADQHSGLYACVQNTWHTIRSIEPLAHIKWANVTLSGCVHDPKHSAEGESAESHDLGVLSSHRAVLLNENVDFQCHTLKSNDSDVSGGSGASKIIWLKHYAPLNWSENSLFNFTDNPNVWRLPTSRIEPRRLRLGSVQPEDEGWYTCVVTSSLKQTLITDISSVYLTILNDTHHLNATGLSDWNFRKGDLLKLKSGERLHNDSNMAITGDGSKEKKFMKKLENIEGELQENSNNNNSNNKLMNSKEDVGGSGGPQFKNIKKLEDNLHKPSGSSVQLMCPATGNPTPNITWTRNNTEIQRTMGRVSYKKWSIQMDDATTEDSGIYKCTICNIHGCIEHSTKVTIRDRLRSPPIISDKFPQNQTVLVNNSTYLECRVVSDLEPSIKWFKYTSRRNVTIKELEQTALKTVNKVLNDQNFLLDSVVTLNPDPDRPNILNFTNITHDDEGWYTCVASNTLGHSLASAYMRVVDKLMSRDLGPLRGHPVWITAVAVVVVLLFLLGTVFIIYVLRKLKHEKLLKQRIETVHQWTKKVIIYRPPNAEGNGCADLQMPVIKIEKQRTTFTTSSSSDPMQGFNEYEFPLDSNWEISRNQLTLGSVLGEGAFGRVVMAEATNLTGQQQRIDSTTTITSASTMTTALNNTTIVAVKMVKEEHTDADMTSLVHEMEVMKMIGKHINIINLLGCCSQNGPLWVIVEFAPHGNLKDFLKKNRHWAQNWDHLNRSEDYFKKQKEINELYEDDNDEINVIQLTEKHLISFAFQIARGMQYLASRRCIHRDLAARNVLVSNDFVMKIADFGLARDVQDTDYYRKKTNGRLPIKWMAPESLQDKFYDSQSDVWSYGVLLWEIMTFGEQPYPQIMSTEELYSYLIAGQRMEKPARCSLNIYMLMRQCWHFDSNARPTFTEIVENLDKILQSANSMANEEYLDLSIPILETPPSSSDDDESQLDNSNEMTPLRYQYTYKLN